MQRYMIQVWLTLQFQEKVDTARERIDGREISEADLAELDADLLEAMPDAVRSHTDLESANANNAPIAYNTNSSPSNVV